MGKKPAKSNSIDGKDHFNGVGAPKGVLAAIKRFNDVAPDYLKSIDIGDSTLVLDASKYLEEDKLDYKGGPLVVYMWSPSATIPGQKHLHISEEKQIKIFNLAAHKLEAMGYKMVLDKKLQVTTDEDCPGGYLTPPKGKTFREIGIDVITACESCTKQSRKIFEAGRKPREYAKAPDDDDNKPMNNIKRETHYSRSCPIQPRKITREKSEPTITR